MPELPEVETVRRHLLPEVKGKKIVSVKLTLPKRLVTPEPRRFAKLLTDATILDIHRRGKYLLFHLDNRYDLMLHLGMSGRISLVPHSAPLEKHTHLRLTMEEGRGKKEAKELRFIDPRQFGKIAAIPHGNHRAIPGLASLGIEPLNNKFTLATLRGLLSCKRKMKPLLLDQTKIAGIGNIYADESLFAAQIHPETISCKLSELQLRKLHLAIPAILKKSIRFQGTTLVDESYTNPRGESGRFIKFLKVYGHEDDPCPKCKTTIKRIIISGRSSFFCQNCQPKKRTTKPRK
ncbi:MAG: bifunctional DNA-formamidopyrimidine glycosylase/DNA-(apurinic or apyrimidinic site) lyase [bacterium]|nr:bifunctional DNA-formamidopyrimidine glycosylase/DNA-(apurinic or apyrimidinic site) lyase [bacterium]